MKGYFEAPDGYGEPTLWEPNGDYPRPIMSRHDLHVEYRHLWPVIVEAVTSL